MYTHRKWFKFKIVRVLYSTTNYELHRILSMHIAYNRWWIIWTHIFIIFVHWWVLLKNMISSRIKFQLDWPRKLKILKQACSIRSNGVDRLGGLMSQFWHWHVCVLFWINLVYWRYTWNLLKNISYRLFMFASYCKLLVVSICFIRVANKTQNVCRFYKYYMLQILWPFYLWRPLFIQKQRIFVLDIVFRSSHLTV